MTKTRDSLTIGRDVIRREIIGIEALEASLGPVSYTHLTLPTILLV